MEPWALLQFAFALATAVGGFALIISELHIMERAEEQKWRKELKEKIEKAG